MRDDTSVVQQRSNHFIRFLNCFFKWIGSGVADYPYTTILVSYLLSVSVLTYLHYLDHWLLFPLHYTFWWLDVMMHATMKHCLAKVIGFLQDTRFSFAQCLLQSQNVFVHLAATFKKELCSRFDAPPNSISQPTYS